MIEKEPNINRILEKAIHLTIAKIRESNWPADQKKQVVSRLESKEYIEDLIVKQGDKLLVAGQLDPEQVAESVFLQIDENIRQHNRPQGTFTPILTRKIRRNQ